jgi:signal transduction histidine kinase
MTMDSKEILRQLPLFAGLPEVDLDRLCQMSETLQVPAGAQIIQENTVGDAMFIVLSGEFEVTKRAGKDVVLLARLGTGEVVGEMALLEQVPRNASVHALVDSSVLKVSQQSFRDLVYGSPFTLLAILRTVTSRLRGMEAMLRQNEKMAELGKLAAGLAHELNNPAAAVRRSSAQLKSGLITWLDFAAQLDALHLDEQQIQARSNLRNQLGTRVSASDGLDPIARSDLENDISTWLESAGVDQPWDVAPILVTFGWNVAELQALAAIFTTEQLPVLAQWLGAGHVVYGLLDEVGMSAERISEIVKAVKDYSFLDRAPIQQVNVQDGLESTLTILKHKLKEGVTVKRDYARDLPRIEAYASELNQVWTNIIDNAVDAMQGKGELLLRTYAQEGEVVVEICDNGPGIPPETQAKIFDPFFTTKPMGVGTGLGLDIVHNIIAQKHRGQIKVDSQPGRTCFKVMLPLRVTRE